MAATKETCNPANKHGHSHGHGPDCDCAAFGYEGSEQLKEAFKEFAECFNRGLFGPKEKEFKDERSAQDLATVSAGLEAMGLIFGLDCEPEMKLSRTTLLACLNFCFESSHGWAVQPTIRDRNIVARLLMGFIDPQTGHCYNTGKACVVWTADDSFAMPLHLDTCVYGSEDEEAVDEGEEDEDDDDDEEEEGDGEPWIISAQEAFVYSNCFYLGVRQIFMTRTYSMVDTPEHPLDCHCKGSHINKRFAVPNADTVADLLERASLVGSSATKPFGVNWIHVVGRVFAVAAARDHVKSAPFMELCDVLAKPEVRFEDVAPRCFGVPKIPAMLPGRGLPATKESAKFVYQCLMWCKY